MEEICYSNREISDIYKDFAILLCKDFVDMEKLAGEDKGRCALVKMLHVLGSDDGMIDAARKREDDLLIAKLDGKEEGFEQGVEQSKKEMIIAMFKNDIPIEKISKCANISIEETKNILEQTKED